ncbi:hypothetical protein DL546_002734 [Coniochaeta pulveracea]|uniref:Phenylacetyl-CoA ligase n=1 Tax=Coniochaeta pulveracea TaxID=177199 RepID=A0A420XZ43_9PEZI|nr:hypothetical protein DL546_002734 [Coniochaeta pulveracea]
MLTSGPDPPDSITIGEFVSNEYYGRQPIARSRNPFTCGITGKTYTTAEAIERTELIARALSKIMGWEPNAELPFDKVIGIYSLNHIDYISVLLSIHRLSGIATPANAAYSAAELEHQLRTSRAKVLFTCAPVLEDALQAAKAVGISQDHVFILDIPGYDVPKGFLTIHDLVDMGRNLPELEKLNWSKGQGARQTAFLCYSSGTSGLPKAVMISHRNIIANMMQFRVYEQPARKKFGIETQVGFAVLPLSHAYGLHVVALSQTWRGDELIVMPKFDLTTYLKAIERFKIQCLTVVPPIIIRMLSSMDECQKYDLSSVRALYVGAAPTGKETVDELHKHWPHWHVCQGYGMTETATVTVSTSEDDIMEGSSGSILPGIRAKVIDFEGKEVTDYDVPGELWIQSPSTTLGYLNNEVATSEAFVWDDDGRWMKTGDEVIVTKSPNGNEHIKVVDRIKELIKVKGHQVAPAELEAHLLTHPFVDDCAVISVPHAQAGEAPKAFVVKSPSHIQGKSDEQAMKEILQYVADHKARYKWLTGGVEFIDVVPKSPSGKILRRLLRDKEKERRRAEGSKL